VSDLDDIARSATRRSRRWDAEDAAREVSGRVETVREKSRRLGERSNEMKRHGGLLASRGHAALDEGIKMPTETTELRVQREADEAEIDRELDRG